MDAHRLRAPSADGALLAIPSLEDCPGLLAENAERLAGWDHDFQGRPASRLRALVKQQVLRKARIYLDQFGLDAPSPGASAPLVVTGHQPELFHPGVWIKNFAAWGIARAASATSLNLVVDNDVPKPPSIRIPGRAGLVRVAFDERHVDSPYEDRRVEDESLFASFGGRVREALGDQVVDPIIDEFWREALAARSATDRVGLRVAVARRKLEASWGVRNLEVPLSVVCESEGFLWFVSHVLANLPRFQEVHNEALDTYRALYGIRSRNHPVPALGRVGEWLEAPFWVWREEKPRRSALLVRQRAQIIELRIGGEAEPFIELPLGPEREACCAVERLMELPSKGVRLRSRALTTTMFSRLLLGDLFLHGIGGAKYDELGDTIAARFFRFEPPSYATLSMTLWLGLAHEPSSRAGLQAARRTLRDLDWNPERYLDGTDGEQASDWIAAKRRAIAATASDAAGKRGRFRAIRRCNEALRDLVRGRREALEGEIPILEEAVERDGVARNREYSMVLHSARRVREAVAGSIPGLEGMASPL